MTILVIEDEEDLALLIRRRLTSEGFRVLCASDGCTGLDLAFDQDPDLIVLDLMLPDLEGLEICRRIRQKRDTPILILTAKSDEVDRVVGLELGADDYVTKPFSLQELVARIHSILRRMQRIKQHALQPSPEFIEHGDLKIDTTRHEVRVGDRLVDLTPAEFRLLTMLASQPGRAFSRSYLLEQLWNREDDGADRSVANCVCRLRRRLGHGDDSASCIQTVWGIGYRFQRS